MIRLGGKPASLRGGLEGGWRLGFPVDISRDRCPALPALYFILFTVLGLLALGVLGIKVMLCRRPDCTARRPGCKPLVCAHALHLAAQSQIAAG